MATINGANALGVEKLTGTITPGKRAELLYLPISDTNQKDLFEEMKGRIKEDDESVPYFYNGYFYITRFEKGKDYTSCNNIYI